MRVENSSPQKIERLLDLNILGGLDGKKEVSRNGRYKTVIYRFEATSKEFQTLSEVLRILSTLDSFVFETSLQVILKVGGGE